MTHGTFENRGAVDSTLAQAGFEPRQCVELGAYWVKPSRVDEMAGGFASLSIARAKEYRVTGAASYWRIEYL